MRILLCCPTPTTATLGASKVYLEAAEGFRRIGWDAVVVSPDEVAGGKPGGPSDQPARLRDYLRLHASKFDVVEYEHHQLPFPRADFPSRPLFVARSILLEHCVSTTWIPPRPRIRSRIGWLLKSWRQLSSRHRLIRQADLTMAAADMINVCNDHERDTLARHGHALDKIYTFPYGMFPERLNAFHPDPDLLPDPPIVGFVGTFDPRKGMCEFPEIVSRVLSRVPDARFRLLGTAGMVPDADGVREYFHRRLWPHIEVHPRFEPSDLPSLLESVSVGIFPSRLESFGYGVLEMMAAGLPVIAYDIPGPHVMLPQENMVPVGDARRLAGRVSELLADHGQLRTARRVARTRAADFDWVEIASRTASVYSQWLNCRHPGSGSSFA